VKRFAFHRKFRITRGPEIRAVLDAKKSVADTLYILYALPNTLEHPRLVFLVGKKHGNSPRRNRIKRLLREAFRLSRVRLPPDLDLALIPRVRAETPSLDETMRSLISLAGQAEKKRRRRDAIADRAD
jgi:ribonuclease P protein component